MDSSNLSPALQKTADGLFFIVGSGRSGTTLLRAMFDAHSQLAIPSETQMYGYFDLQFRKEFEEGRARDEVLHKFLATSRISALKVSEERVREMLGGVYDWDRLFLALLTGFREDRGVERVGEKTPKHIMVYDQLASLFPKSKFIHIVRDPRAVVASYTHAKFYQYTDGTNPYRAIQKWTRVMDKHFEAEQKLGPSRYTLLRYEDLAAQPTAELQRLCSFLDVPFEEQMLDFQNRAEAGHIQDQTNLEGIRREVHTESVEKWRKNLPSEAIAVVDAMCWDQMKKLGYKPDSDSPQPRAERQESKYRLESNARQTVRRLGQKLKLSRGGMKNDAE
jgi:hypothetical protein